ncbi:hypothetical protein C2G38_2191301 [Gigaspora rosea]|uniref:Ig-like domain-containing protein n=1 Tax=Gigaspora rosea TaxID=44941 RepID=A0A397V2T9_9GLOM|nr:hypothetical protein C2G38_2191301 [Gigaspora rosea]
MSIKFLIFLPILVAFIYTLPIPQQSIPPIESVDLSPSGTCYSVGQNVTASWMSEPGVSDINVTLTIAGVTSNITYYTFTVPWSTSSVTFSIISQMLSEVLCKASLAYENNPTFLLGVKSFTICK